ncbi:MAG: ATP phosphoribosyltransferase [Candidatus Daviesbacteria bacterium]|nr:ATP phosphoribosyltransferase [Candidatus Daviesbacteria bacterium]
MIKENIFAIPSKERLKRETLELLSDSGIELDISGRQLSTKITDPKLGDFTVAFMRPKDIVRMVAVGEIPIGIAGLDTVEEYNLEALSRSDWGQEWKLKTGAQILLKLGIGRCRLMLAAPLDKDMVSEQEFEKQGKYKNLVWKYALEQFEGFTIATSYPNLVSRMFYDLDNGPDDRNTSYTLRQLNGSVEVAPSLGIADSVCDIVETGSTLQENGLKEILTILESEAVLVTDGSNQKGSNRFVDELRDRIFATLLRRNNPDAIKKMNDYNRFVKSQLEGILRYR